MRARAVVAAASAVAVATWPLVARAAPPQAAAADARGAAVVAPSHIAVSCGESARADVRRGASLLVLLAWDQAEAAFARAASREPRCAMAHWGVALACARLPDGHAGDDRARRGREAILRAQALALPTDAERGQVTAAARLYLPESRDARLRLVDFRDALLAVARDAPDDDIAPVLAAWASLSISTVPGDAPQRAAARAVVSRFGAAPTNPGAALALAASLQNPDDAPASRAVLDAAANVLPAVPLARHLLAHGYAAGGWWTDAVAQDLLAADAADDGGLSLVHGGHVRCAALEWRIHAYLMGGRYAAARILTDWWESALSSSAITPPEGLDFRARARLSRVRLALASRDWRQPVETWPAAADADALPLRAAGAQWREPFDEVAFADAAVLFARGLREARRAWPRGDGAALGAAHAAADGIEALALQGAGTRADLLQALLLASIAAAQEQAELVDLMLSQAASLQRRLEADGSGGLPVVVVGEVAGDLWLLLHRYRAAADAYGEALQQHPGRPRSAVGRARALARLGDLAGARAAWATLAQNWLKADADLPELAESRAALSGGPR